MLSFVSGHDAVKCQDVTLLCDITSLATDTGHLLNPSFLIIFTLEQHYKIHKIYVEKKITEKN